jgi:predicted nucleic acid-binding protein
MKLLISDANILIDLEEGQIVGLIFQLEHHFVTPDLLFEEELRDGHAHLVDLGLELKELTSESMSYTFELTQRFGKPSRNDCLTIALAKQEECPLLTGDKHLREAAAE